MRTPRLRDDVRDRGSRNRIPHRGRDGGARDGARDRDNSTPHRDGDARGRGNDTPHRDGDARDRGNDTPHRDGDARGHGNRIRSVRRDDGRDGGDDAYAPPQGP